MAPSWMLVRAPHTDAVHVAANDRLGPDRDIVPEHHVPQHHRAGVNHYPRAQLRAMALEVAQCS